MALTVTVVAGEFEDLVMVGLSALFADDDSVELLASRVPTDCLAPVLDAHRPAVCLLNIGSLPSPACVYELHQSHPHCRIVVMGNSPTTAECNQMLALGATACIPKNAEGRDVINAIQLASRGMHVIPPAESVAGFSEGVATPGAELMTPREAEVLALLQQGRANGEIAHELSIGLETVRTHARNIYRKLGVNDRRQLHTLPNRGAVPAVPSEPPGAAATS